MNQKEKPRREEKPLWAKCLLFFFFPPKCAVCKRVGYENLCPQCQEKLDAAFAPTKHRPWGGCGFADEMFSLFSYENPCVKTLLLDWKQMDYEDLHSILISYVRKAKEKGFFPKEIHGITYCPRRQSARRKAGFDQAEEMARELAKELDLPFVTLLKRRGFSRSQHKVRGEGRERNVRGVFVATQKLNGENLILVDDIVTTGASCREAARILKKAGAMKVFVFSPAH